MYKAPPQLDRHWDHFWARSRLREGWDSIPTRDLPFGSQI